MSSKRRMPEPTTMGTSMRLSSSSSPSRSSDRTSLGLPEIWVFLPARRLSLPTSSARSPRTRLEGPHPRLSRVLDTTYFGVSFMKSASGTSLPWFGHSSANSRYVRRPSRMASACATPASITSCISPFEVRAGPFLGRLHDAVQRDHQPRNDPAHHDLLSESDGSSVQTRLGRKTHRSRLGYPLPTLPLPSGMEKSPPTPSWLPQRTTCAHLARVRHGFRNAMRKRAWRGRCIGRSRVASPAAGVRDCAPGSSSEQWSTTRALDQLRRCLVAEAEAVGGRRSRRLVVPPGPGPTHTAALSA